VSSDSFDAGAEAARRTAKRMGKPDASRLFLAPALPPATNSMAGVGRWHHHRCLLRDRAHDGPCVVPPDDARPSPRDCCGAWPGTPILPNEAVEVTDLRPAALLSGLDLRCEHFVGPDHRPMFDGCPANRRTRGGAYTADQWCLPCEVRDRLGLTDPGSPHGPVGAPTTADFPALVLRSAGDRARAVLARSERLVALRRWREGDRLAEARAGAARVRFARWYAQGTVARGDGPEHPGTGAEGATAAERERGCPSGW